MNEAFERTYWGSLGIEIPIKTKYYIEVDDVKVEVSEDVMNCDEKTDSVIRGLHRIVNGAKYETEFLFNDKRMPYKFQSIETQYGIIFVRFYVITDEETFKEISNAVLFDGILANSDIHMRCYHTSMQMYDFEKRTFKIGMLGEIKL